MSSERQANAVTSQAADTAADSDTNLLARVTALGTELKGYDPSVITEALARYRDGLSVYYAAREYKLPEQRLRGWIATLGLKRSEAEVLEMRSAAARAAGAAVAEQRREASALRRGATLG